MFCLFFVRLCLFPFISVNPRSFVLCVLPIHLAGSLVLEFGRDLVLVLERRAVEDVVPVLLRELGHLELCRRPGARVVFVAEGACVRTGEVGGVLVSCVAVAVWP